MKNDVILVEDVNCIFEKFKIALFGIKSIKKYKNVGFINKLAAKYQ